MAVVLALLAAGLASASMWLSRQGAAPTAAQADPASAVQLSAAGGDSAAQPAAPAAPEPVDAKSKGSLTAPVVVEEWGDFQ